MYNKKFPFLIITHIKVKCNDDKFYVYSYNFVNVEYNNTRNAINSPEEPAEIGNICLCKFRIHECR